MPHRDLHARSPRTAFTARRFICLAGLTLVLVLIGWLVVIGYPGRHPAQLRVPEPAANHEIARVGDSSITSTEFRSAWAKHGASPSGDVSAKATNVLEDLIRRELLFAEAQRTGFAERDDIRAAWQAFVISRFREELEAGRATLEPIGTEEIIAHYQAHIAEYTSPERRRLAVIWLSVPASASPERRAQLEREARSARDQAVGEAGTARDFGALAATHSSHQPSRRTGGDVGWLTRSQAGRAWPAEVADAAFALAEPGNVTPLLVTDEGWYFLKLIERQPGQPVPLDTVRERIRYELARAHVAQEEARYFAGLRRTHGVQVFDRNLAAAIPEDRSLAHHPPGLPAR